MTFSSAIAESDKEEVIVKTSSLVAAFFIMTFSSAIAESVKEENAIKGKKRMPRETPEKECRYLFKGELEVNHTIAYRTSEKCPYYT